MEVVVEPNQIWASLLLRGTLSQKAELTSLTKALNLGKDKVVNIYTDSQYAFATMHIHRALLTAEGKSELYLW